MPQDLLRVSQRQPHLFIENRRQCQRFGPQLHAADLHRVRGLQGMAPLHPAPAPAAMTHPDIKTAHHDTPHDLFLILRLAAFRLHTAAAMRTARG
jgi:hypothetical protein